MLPFLPWLGSKRGYVRDIVIEFPIVFDSYYEPFLGSGAVFFAFSTTGVPYAFNRTYLSATDRNLINCWRAVKQRPEHVQTMLTHCLAKHSEEFFALMKTQMENPAVFLYVMKAGLASMYRDDPRKVKVEFNVPWRKPGVRATTKPMRHDRVPLDLCSRYLNARDVDISVARWEVALHSVKAGDLVYLDPPHLSYTPNGFVNYESGGFNEDNHVYLRNFAKALGDKGAWVFLSNSDVPASRRIYGTPFKVIHSPFSQRTEGLWRWGPPVPKRIEPPPVVEDSEDDFDDDSEEG